MMQKFRMCRFMKVLMERKSDESRTDVHGFSRSVRYARPARSVLVEMCFASVPGGAEVTRVAAQAGKLDRGALIDVFKGAAFEFFANSGEKPPADETIRTAEIHRSAQHDAARIGDVNDRTHADAQPGRCFVHDFQRQSVAGGGGFVDFFGGQFAI